MEKMDWLARARQAKAEAEAAAASQAGPSSSSQAASHASTEFDECDTLVRMLEMFAIRVDAADLNANTRFMETVWTAFEMPCTIGMHVKSCGGAKCDVYMPYLSMLSFVAKAPEFRRGSQDTSDLMSLGTQTDDEEQDLSSFDEEEFMNAATTAMAAHKLGPSDEAKAKAEAIAASKEGGQGPGQMESKKEEGKGLKAALLEGLHDSDKSSMSEEHNIGSEVELASSVASSQATSSTSLSLRSNNDVRAYYGGRPLTGLQVTMRTLGEFQFARYVENAPLFYRKDVRERLEEIAQHTPQVDAATVSDTVQGSLMVLMWTTIARLPRNQRNKQDRVFVCYDLSRLTLNPETGYYEYEITGMFSADFDGWDGGPHPAAAAAAGRGGPAPGPTPLRPLTGVRKLKRDMFDHTLNQWASGGGSYNVRDIQVELANRHNEIVNVNVDERGQSVMNAEDVHLGIGEASGLVKSTKEFIRKARREVRKMTKRQGVKRQQE